MTGPQMHRIMYDTDRPLTLTHSNIRGELLATYADLFAGPSGLEFLTELRAAWPVVVLIDRGLGDPANLATVIDIERGTHKPADAPGWYDRRHAAGAKDLTVYANRSNLAAVNAAMGGRSYFRWIATDDGTAHVPPFTPGIAPAAIQVLTSFELGFHADMSIVFEPWWHRSPAPADAGRQWVAGALATMLAIEQSMAGVADTLKAHQ